MEGAGVRTEVAGAMAEARMADEVLVDVDVANERRGSTEVS